jgi:PPOX class probable F420-dependent enzyme
VEPPQRSPLPLLRPARAELDEVEKPVTVPAEFGVDLGGQGGFLGRFIAMNLSVSAARERFSGSSVARLATADSEGVPHLVPVTFAIDGDMIYFVVDHKPKRSTDLRRLRNIAENPKVALLVDHYSDDWSQLWWVRLDGEAEVWEHGQGRIRAVELLRAKYHQYVDTAPEGPVVAIKANAWSGWAYEG